MFHPMKFTITDLLQNHPQNFISVIIRCVIMALENKIEQSAQGAPVEKKLNLITNGYKTMEFLLTVESCPPFRVIAFDENEKTIVQQQQQV